MKIILLIGPIASGKSTYTKECVSQGAIVVNDDAVTMAVHGGIYTAYDKRLKPLYKSIEHHIIHFAVAMDRDVIIDRPNLNKDTRARYIQLAKSLDTNIIGVVFKNEGPEIHAQRRFNSDNRGCSYEIWLSAAKYQDERYEKPSVQEGFTNLIYV